MYVLIHLYLTEQIHCTTPELSKSSNMTKRVFKTFLIKLQIYDPFDRLI